MITIALDAMGPDAGPGVVVEGAAQVSREDVPIRMVLVGDGAQIEPLLKRQAYDRSRLSLLHTADWVRQDEKPAVALDQKAQCSALLAADLVARGEADALVGAGSTGALILAASRKLERVAGVHRCALATVHPTEQQHGPHDDPFALMLDVGATLTVEARDLVSFAVMGSAYSRIISSIESPRVALLSNGTEPTKGTAAIVEAHRLLAAMPGINFVGNVEGLDIPKGTVDVVVCEGFLGNVVLKMLEGVSEVVSDIAKDAYARKFLWKLGLMMLSEGIRQIRTMTDWRQYGGAPVLGFTKPVIKAHGRSNAWAIRNAIRVARKTVERDLGGAIRAGMATAG
ncbi:MAG: phosphate acyltransferase PlsX [bacterium]